MFDNSLWFKNFKVFYIKLLFLPVSSFIVCEQDYHLPRVQKKYIIVQWRQIFKKQCVLGLSHVEDIFPFFGGQLYKIRKYTSAIKLREKTVSKTRTRHAGRK